MTPDAAGIEAALADVLAAHYTYTAGRGMTVRCKCGEVVGERGGRASIGNSATHRAHLAAALLPVVTQAQAEALRAAAQVWRGFVADGRCPTCQMGRSRETVGMICQTCGTDYARADESGA